MRILLCGCKKNADFGCRVELTSCKETTNTNLTDACSSNRKVIRCHFLINSLPSRARAKLCSMFAGHNFNHIQCLQMDNKPIINIGCPFPCHMAPRSNSKLAMICFRNLKNP